MAHRFSVASRRAHPTSLVEAIGKVVVPAMMYPDLASDMEVEGHTSMHPSLADAEVSGLQNEDAGVSGLQNEDTETSFVSILHERAKKEQKPLRVRVDLDGRHHHLSSLSEKGSNEAIMTLTRQGDTNFLAEQVIYGFGPLSDFVSFSVTPTSFIMYYGQMLLFEVNLEGAEERDYAKNAQEMFGDCIASIRQIWTRAVLDRHFMKATRATSDVVKHCNAFAARYGFQYLRKDQNAKKLSSIIKRFLKNKVDGITSFIDRESPWRDWLDRVNDYVIDFAWIRHLMTADLSNVIRVGLDDGKEGQVLKRIAYNHIRTQVRLRDALVSNNKLPLTIRVSDCPQRLLEEPNLGIVTQTLESRKKPMRQSWERWVSLSDGARTHVFPAVDFSASLDRFLWADWKKNTETNSSMN